MRNYLVIFLLGLMFLGCTKPWYCGEVVGIEAGSALVIYPFHTASDEYVYSFIESRSLYNRDSLQVLNEDGRPFPFVRFQLESDPRSSLKSFYSIVVAPAFILPDDKDAFISEKTRKIYLKYNHQTSDTLTLVFKTYKNKCDVGIYEYLKIYHKNKLVHSIEDNIFASFTLNH